MIVGQKSKNGRVTVTDPKEAFERHVIRADECWSWSGYHNAAGYGVARFGGRGAKAILAHRLAWLVANGAHPADMHVLHRCDNPGCVNPAHLFLGTNADNIADRMKKGRPAGTAKLTKAAAEEIIARYRAGENTGALAKAYAVTREHAWRVCTGRARIPAWEL